MTAPREVVGPCTCDGALVRLVTDETLDWVERWNGRSGSGTRPPPCGR
jgi:hypothetical protein